MPTKPTEWRDAADRLTAALHLHVAPIAISFGPSDAPPFAEASVPMPASTADGRTGRVPAGCVFWVHALDRTFSTRPEDHGNCSVGSLTHGLIDLQTAATRADVGALVEAGWVTPDIFPSIPTVATRPEAISYGPLTQATRQPDVVLVRTPARGVMTICDALPDLVIEGKPQCHIVAIAHEQQRPAASVGCALSRARTGMGAHEMTCALPGSRRNWAVTDLADALESACDEQYPPTWDEERGEVTWDFGLGEPNPRGQYNATMAAADAMTEGGWWRLGNESSQARFSEPTVSGVDFPTVALTSAEWDPNARQLHLTLDPINESAVGQPTQMRVSGLGDPAAFNATSPDGGPVEAEMQDTDLVLRTRVGRHSLVVGPN